MAMNPRLLRPRASGGFTPKNISGLALWLDGADLSTFGTTADGPSAIADNQPVKYWGDKSGNGRHATTTEADSAAPTYIASATAGRSALGFDGGDYLSGTWSLTLTKQAVFVVLRTLKDAASRIFTQSDDGVDFQTTGHYIPMLGDLSGNLCGFTSGSFATSASLTSSVWTVACCQHVGTQIQVNVNNGAVVSTNTPSLNKTFTRYRIGASLPSTTTGSPSSFFRDRIAEVVVYDTSLNDTDRQAVANYLGKKWGVTIS